MVVVVCACVFVCVYVWLCVSVFVCVCVRVRLQVDFIGDGAHDLKQSLILLYFSTLGHFHVLRVSQKKKPYHKTKKAWLDLRNYHDEFKLSKSSLRE